MVAPSFIVSLIAVRVHVICNLYITCNLYVSYTLNVTRWNMVKEWKREKHVWARPRSYWARQGSGFLNLVWIVTVGGVPATAAEAFGKELGAENLSSASMLFQRKAPPILSPSTLWTFQLSEYDRVQKVRGSDWFCL